MPKTIKTAPIERSPASSVELAFFNELIANIKKMSTEQLRKGYSHLVYMRDCLGMYVPQEVMTTYRCEIELRTADLELRMMNIGTVKQLNTGSDNNYNDGF